MVGPTLWAVSDLHAAVKANQSKIDRIHPRHQGDWLIVAGDVAEKFELIVSVMETLAKRFAKVIWVPGNHELFSSERSRYQGRDKYVALVQAMRDLGVVTPRTPTRYSTGSRWHRCLPCMTTHFGRVASAWMTPFRRRAITTFS